MRLGILGGTFNPVHFGHLRAAEEVRQKLGLDRVLFVPSDTPPLKDKGLAPVETRYRMVELAIAGNPGFALCDIERGRSGPSYTIDTIKQLRERYPGDELFFIIGSDAFAALPQWKDPQGLLSRIDFVIMGRPPQAFAELEGSEHIRLRPEDLRSLQQNECSMVEADTQSGRKALLVTVTAIEISATQIRQQVKRGGSIRYLLPEAVELFIISHGLYKDG